MDIAGGTHQLLLDHVLLEVSRPVRRQATWATPLTQLHRAFEMTEFDAEARQPGGTEGPAGSRRDGAGDAASASTTSPQLSQV